MKTTFLKTPVEPQLLAAFWALSAQSDVSPLVLLRKIVSPVLAQSGYEIDDYDPDTERTNDHAQWLRRRKKNRADEDGTHPRHQSARDRRHEGRVRALRQCT